MIKLFIFFLGGEERLNERFYAIRINGWDFEWKLDDLVKVIDRIYIKILIKILVMMPYTILQSMAI